ncbi:pistil-specific extensin-like protein [Triticum dicoccoides]|uniref:pistil-specific extensin-like protein n=1 Tax=Triticum dicoccoides TaxID=85692 RepID=UPI001891964B|nr:pistil-specific extensin-like protein [Triticum dicoccoides]
MARRIRPPPSHPLLDIFFPRLRPLPHAPDPLPLLSLARSLLLPRALTGPVVAGVHHRAERRLHSPSMCPRPAPPSSTSRALPDRSRRGTPPPPASSSPITAVASSPSIRVISSTPAPYELATDLPLMVDPWSQMPPPMDAATLTYLSSDNFLVR